ncbi:MAG: hypothetical protein JWP92_3713 [Caulobacter sp.]|nr:hypothetical protein [Caulobacter sp.]
MPDHSSTDDGPSPEFVALSMIVAAFLADEPRARRDAFAMNLLRQINDAREALPQDGAECATKRALPFVQSIFDALARSKAP